jgi:RNA polymerase sigma-70 factor (ECF subfamily)
VQQAFLIAQQKSDQIRDPGRPLGWLLAVVRNAYLKEKRRRQPIPAANLQLDLDALADVPDAPDDIDEEALQAAIDNLSDDFKVVLMMFYFEERSYLEIAEELNVPPGTVMSRLSRAKSFLRRRLAPADIGSGKGIKSPPRPVKKMVVG